MQQVGLVSVRFLVALIGAALGRALGGGIGVLLAPKRTTKRDAKICAFALPTSISRDQKPDLFYDLSMDSLRSAY